MESLNRDDISQRFSSVIRKRLKIKGEEKIDLTKIFSESQILCIMYELEFEFDIMIDESEIKLSTCNYASILDLVEKLMLMNQYSCPTQNVPD